MLYHQVWKRQLKYLKNNMDYKTALITLVKNSHFDEKATENILKDIDNMTDEEIIELGKVLAKQKKREIKNIKTAIKAIDEFLEK